DLHAPQPRAHLLKEARAILRRPAVDLDALDVARGAYGFELALRLPTRSIEDDGLRAGAGKIIRREAAGGASPHLTEFVGFNEREQFARFRVVEVDVEPRLVTSDHVRLQPEQAFIRAPMGIVEARYGSAHHLQHRAARAQSAARLVRRVAGSLRFEDGFDGGECLFHRQQLRYVLFGQEEWRLFSSETP